MVYTKEKVSREHCWRVKSMLVGTGESARRLARKAHSMHYHDVGKAMNKLADTEFRAAHKVDGFCKRLKKQ